MDVLLGFDPGGQGKFGWAVCIDKNDGLNVLAAGTADHAEGAMEESLRVIPKVASVVAAGIDAPMFWSIDGYREADHRVRRGIATLGSSSPGGTVQNFNSLRGACVIQGLLILNLLRRSFPTIPITESHPKALLWLMMIAKKDFGPNNIKINNLKEIIIKGPESVSEDERDAILGAFTAQAMMRKKMGWEDLLQFERENDLVLAGKPPIAYWMPKINKVT